MKLILHPITKLSIDNFLDKPSQGLLITAQSGSGKGTIAKYIVSKILNIDFNKLITNQNIIIINQERTNITIEQIREINKFLKLKTAGKSSIRRAVIIEHAELMGLEAQNAFLKNLEEPPKDTIIILTSSSKDSILSTISSRVQQINILPPSKKDINNFYSDRFSTEKINKAFYLSEGHIGLLDAILKKDTVHPLVEQIEVAKDIYRKTVFERLNLVDEISKKGNLNDFLLALELVSHAALINAISKNDPSIKSWTNRSKYILESQQFLTRSPNTKLLLTNLFINI